MPEPLPFDPIAEARRQWERHWGPEPVPAMGLPAGAKLRRYVVTDLVTVQIPVRREVVCWEDAEGNVHELDKVEAPEEAKKAGVPGQATWWFNDGPEAPAG